MPKPTYPLKTYIKTVEALLMQHGFDRVNIVQKSGSAVRFDLFREASDKEPHTMWVVHTSHDQRHFITSIEDYRKAARNLNITLDTFLDTLKNM